MEVAIRTTDKMNEKMTADVLFSYLDIGIDDMEAGRVHTADEAFQIIRERMKKEL